MLHSRLRMKKYEDPACFFEQDTTALFPSTGYSKEPICSKAWKHWPIEYNTWPAEL